MSRSTSQCHALVTKQSAAPRRGNNASYHRLRNSCGGSLSAHRSTSFGASSSAVGRSARSYWSAISSPRTALSIMGVIALERLSPSLAPNSHSKSRSCEIRHMETFEQGACREFSWCERRDLSRFSLRVCVGWLVPYFRRIKPNHRRGLVVFHRARVDARASGSPPTASVVTAI